MKVWPPLAWAIRPASVANGAENSKRSVTAPTSGVGAVTPSNGSRLSSRVTASAVVPTVAASIAIALPACSQIVRCGRASATSISIVPR